MILWKCVVIRNNKENSAKSSKNKKAKPKKTEISSDEKTRILEKNKEISAKASENRKIKPKKTEISSNEKTRILEITKKFRLGQVRIGRQSRKTGNIKQWKSQNNENKKEFSAKYAS